MTATRLAIGIGGINIEVEGEEEFAREVFDFFKDKLAERVSTAPVTPAPTERGTREVEGADQPPLREFYAEKGPRTDIERVTVFVYYKSKFEGIGEVSENDLLPMFDEAQARRPKRIRNALNNARRTHGWFERGTRAGVYRISSAGKNLVEHDLPRQPSGR